MTDNKQTNLVILSSSVEPGESEKIMPNKIQEHTKFNQFPEIIGDNPSDIDTRHYPELIYPVPRESEVQNTHERAFQVNVENENKSELTV